MKPKKKDYDQYSGRAENIYIDGWNEACDEWEKHLPSEDEIKSKVWGVLPDSVLIKWTHEDIEKLLDRIAKAIHKRIS